MADTDADLVALLRSAKEKLCRAQVLAASGDSLILGAALDRIQLVGCRLPGWAEYDRPDAPREAR